MSDKIRGRPFEKGNQAAKNRQRRVSYEALFAKALESEGALFVQKITEFRDSEDVHVSLKACDIFFKYARPPEREEVTLMPDTSYFRHQGLTLEEGLQLRQQLQEAQAPMIESLVQRIVEARDSANGG